MYQISLCITSIILIISDMDILYYVRVE